MNDPIKYKGARFYKCALQVNPYSYKQKYRDGDPIEEAAYNEQILEQCRANGIEVVGLADHGNVDNSEGLRQYLADNGIVVFPGVEIASSGRVHMVCLYPEDTEITYLHGHLAQLMGGNNLKLKDDPTCASTLSCEQIAEIIKGQGGFWYAAHAADRNGLLRLSGDGGNYKDLWKKSDLVYAIQIQETLDTLEAKYRDIILNKNPDYKRENGKEIAVINARDISEPSDLSHPSASCRIKMTDPNFKAFRMAFKDSTSRIRLNHDTPSPPKTVIESICWQGAGLFENQGLILSPDLNTIIGGRGTGKSSLIESIRFALGMSGDERSNHAKNIISSNLKGSKVEIKVHCGSQHGQVYIISRRFGEGPVVTDEAGEVSLMTPKDLLPNIEILGQNEILRIEEDNAEKFSLLEKFLPETQNFSGRINDIKIKLRENRNKMVSALADLESMQQKISREGLLKEKKGQYKQHNIEEKLRDSSLLIRETQIKERVDDQFNHINKWLTSYDAVFDIEFLNPQNTKGLPNEALLAEIYQIFQALKKSLDGLAQQGVKEVKTARSEYESKCVTWTQKRNLIQDQINQAIASLQGYAGKSGKEIGHDYKQIMTELTLIEQLKKGLNTKQKVFDTLRAERRALLEKYKDTAFYRYSEMDKSIKRLNKESLKGKIKICLSRCADLSNLKNFMQEISGIGPRRIKWLDEAEEGIDLREWSDWIEERAKDKFKAKYGAAGLTDSIAESLISISFEKRLEIEEIELGDTIDIALNVAHGEGENYVPMEKLSVGQKCTAILNLLLTEIDEPLIIDQPEDNLDNAFIAERIVSELRKLKTHRQFIFATHNANIPIFGDAELIVVLENRESKTTLEGIGSIDSPEIREQAAQILEGGEAAFNMRKEKYGF